MSPLRIALVGAAASAQDTPWDDPDLQVWGLGMHIEKMERADRYFEMHDRSIWDRYLGKEDGPYARQLDRQDVPVVMREQHTDIAYSERFPFERVLDRFEPVAANWFTDGYYVSSVSYMLAYALLEKPDEVRLYGLHMNAAHEYGYQKANVEFWLGVAAGMGVRVWIHPHSPLCRTANPYGSPKWYRAGADTTQKARFKQGMERGRIMAI